MSQLQILTNTFFGLKIKLFWQMSKKKPTGSLKNYVPHFTPFHSLQNHIFLLFLKEEIHLRLPFTVAFIKIAPLRGQTKRKKIITILISKCHY